MSLFSSGMVRPHSSKIAFIHRAIDAAVIMGCLLVAMEITRDLSFNDRHYLQAGVWSILIFSMVGTTQQVYGSWRVQPLHMAVAATLITWFWTAIILVCLAFLTKTSSDFSRAAILTWFAMTPVALGIARISLRLGLKFFRANGRNTRTLAIAGKTKLGQQIAEKIIHTHWLGMRFIGFFDDRMAPVIASTPPTIRTASAVSMNWSRWPGAARSITFISPCQWRLKSASLNW